MPRGGPPEIPRLRVAIVAPSVAILGGQAIQAQRLLAAWTDDPEVEAWLVPINPAPPRWLGFTSNLKYLRTVVTQALYWPLLMRELQRADVIHVFSASYLSFVLAPWPAVLVARRLGRPVLLNYRSGEAPDHLRRSRLARATLNRVDENVVPSSFLAEVMAAHGIGSRVIPNIVDREQFRFRLRDPLRPRLLSTRNFESLYNVECTLRAFERIQNRYPDATLTLVGGGAKEESLRRQVTAMGLRRVTFAGRVRPDQITRYYADANIYVQTPNIDNMPSSVLEAFASGLPVVSTNAGGVPAIVTDDVHGLLAPVGDADGIASAVARLIEEPGLAARLVTAAYKKTDGFVWERVRQQWLSVYRSLLRPEPVGRLRPVSERQGLAGASTLHRTV
jgi:glycosyltransferase involved in cell wall biosynthesis